MNIEDPRRRRGQRYDTILWAFATAWFVWSWIGPYVVAYATP